MSITGSRSLYVIAIIYVCFCAGCAGDRHKEQLDTSPAPLDSGNHPSRVLSGERSAQEQLAEKRLSLRALEYETNTFNNQAILFDFDSSDISSEAAVILKDKAATLERHPQFMVQIEGHCDERGTIEYNLALGDRRASAARDYLIELGIAPERIQTITYGKERPFDPSHTEEAWAKNRRDRFNLLKP